MTPFSLIFVRAPRTPLSIPVQETTLEPSPPGERVTRLMERAREAWEQGKEAIRRAQEKQAEAANRKRREPDFGVGDMVMVSKKGWSTDRPTTRLDTQFAGPYKILAAKGDSFEVDLPQSIQTSHTIHASRLRKAATDPLPGQRQKPPPVEMIDNEPEWVVSKVLSSRIYRGKLQYQAEWEGLDPDPTFYDAESFRRAPMRIQEFHDRNTTAAGPPVRLQYWLEAAADGIEAWKHDDNNSAVKKGARKTRRH